MVDYYGNWTYEKNTPEEKKCDCDRLADEIMYQIKEGKDQCGEEYIIKTSIENLIAMILLHYENYLECEGNEDMEIPEDFDVNFIMEEVVASGGLREFDYYA